MPELPEVQTTATMLHPLVRNKRILDVWTDYESKYWAGKDNIKNPSYFKKFKKEIVGKKIIRVYRRAKNVLIDIEGASTILIHMKMTGHLLYGKYVKKYEALNQKSETNPKSKIFKWVPEDKKSPLNDPFSRFIHLVFTLSDGHHIAFSDMRKFATVTLIPDKVAFGKHFEKVGPEPLEKDFDWRALRKQFSRFPSSSIKTVLINHEVVAGIGNIYSDEILWLSNIHPERKIKEIKDTEYKTILLAIKKLLNKGIDFGGDSMSDYRNPHGERGAFQHEHNAYRKTGKPCTKRGCKGKILRKVIGQRSAHFCNIHQN